MCLLFMAITQLHIVKELPYLASNTMAILTCLPMAIGILAFGKIFSKLFENKLLLMVGEISYEIYLVHAFTLNLVRPSIILSYILHMGMRKVKNDRFNSCNSYKK